ncbi:Benzaldehyde lyase [Pseudomonas reidholzensis]|uniref:Benzaldehyde lyase n=1 Tax=Pseudomonas reidholzensis TaxID=1785162 RepID=A0A383RWY3_9PSED|nr:thiamine pyrophosphate-binding protein [Pseudomonas reidholzensis]SYX90996.1 Benzaldehyde lyase [Pseudomonas reidholzensis]
MHNSQLLTGGDVLAATLAKAGVKDIFTLHGGHLDGLFKACKDLDINLFDTRHEASAGHAAEAYARVKGDLGVCVVTSGPGFTNVISSIVNAKSDQTPVLYIVGAPPLREAHTNPLQGGFDQIAMATPGAKLALRITHAERIADQLALAIREARNAPYGPVLVEVPIDVMHMLVHPDDLTAPTGLAVQCRPAPSRRDLNRIVEQLKKAKRPALIVGGSVRYSHCGELLSQVALKFALPVFSNAGGRGILRNDHPLHFADPGLIATLDEAHKPDLIINLGARSGMFLGGRSKAIVGDQAFYIQVHNDPAELGRVNEASLALNCDYGELLASLYEENFKPAIEEGWVDALRAARHALAHPAYPADSGGAVHPGQAVAQIVQSSGENALFVIEGGETGLWALDGVEVNRPGHVLSYGYLGCLGTGPGFALGAAIASPDSRVVLISGDGAFGFHLQELDSMNRHHTPVINVVLNNECWGMSIHGQEMLYGKGYSAVSRLGGLSYAAIGGGFGCHAEQVTRLEDLAPAMARAIASGKPAVIEVMTDPQVVHPVMHLMLSEPADPSREIVIPYYENIPLRDLSQR